MNGDSPVPPGRVPTLTEVVAWPDPAGSPEAASTVPAPVTPQPPAAPGVLPQSAVTEAQLNERVLADVQRQIDLMLDYRLREVLTPLLSRVADNLVRDVRTELASTLREVVARAVAQELARHRVR